MAERFDSYFRFSVKLFLYAVLVVAVIKFHVSWFYYLSVYSMWYAWEFIPESYADDWSLFLYNIFFYICCMIYAALGFALFYQYRLFRHFLWFNVLVGLVVGWVAQTVYREGFDWERVGVFGMFLTLAVIAQFYGGPRLQLKDE